MAGGAKRDVDGDDDDDDDKDDNNYDCGNDYDCDDNDYDNDNEDESSLYLHVISILVFTTRLHGLKKFIWQYSEMEDVWEKFLVFKICNLNSYVQFGTEQI